MLRSKRDLALEDDQFWYKDAIIYQLHIRAFYDSNADGIGDVLGLTQKLDYLKDLGVGAIWLLPFYPSPLRDDGYDIADYTNVHPSYGALRDVKLLIREAHRRGLRVVSELVCNHTSDQHAWFQRAQRAKHGSIWRDFYVWSDTTSRFKDARTIFKDFETSNWTWDPVSSAYYWHRFYSHQPDLNYDNPHVRRAIFKVIDFWLEMGFDGLRLDAVPYLYEQEGTNCENLPKTHAFLKELRRHVDQFFPHRMLLAEANQWPEDAITYFGTGDECQMAFHFPIMPRMFMAIHMEDSFPIVDILAQTPPIPEIAQWALFLRNHDELTLEMVTDEERDYMYRVYARDPEARINLGIRRRLAPLLGNHRRRIELMNGLLFSLPGTPVIYYGDEIGMGDNIYLGDRNGVRTPMQWSADRNAGFSRANSQRLYLPVISDPEYHYETVNVETQQKNPHSLLWWMKRLIALRKRFKAFGRGSLQVLFPENRKVLAFIRRYDQEVVLVVANLSRFVQFVELDLASLRGMVPVEVFGRTEFPPIGECPYFITLGPHAFYWFSLEPQRVAAHHLSSAAADPATEATIPLLTGSWDGKVQSLLVLFQGTTADILSSYLQRCSWYRGRARRIKSTRLRDAVAIPHAGAARYIAMVQVDYPEGDEEIYALPVAFATGDRARQLVNERQGVVLARLKLGDTGEEGAFYDPFDEPAFNESLLETLGSRHHLRGAVGEVSSTTTRILRQLVAASDRRLIPSILKTQQSNSLVSFGDQLVLKLFHRLEAGINPDLEIGRFLTERGFVHIPRVVGALEYHTGQDSSMTLALLEEFVPNARDGWQFTLDALGHYFERALSLSTESQGLSLSAGTFLELAAETPIPLARESIGTYLESAKLLGQRTAQLHSALAADLEDSSFAPEPFSSLHQRSIFQSMRVLTQQVCQTLNKRLGELQEPARSRAHRVLALEGKIVERFRNIRDCSISAMRIRCHGNYHLEQVLYTGKDFVIIDFEGEPARPLSERQIKRSPLRDVASMLRSFHYASCAALVRPVTGVMVRPEDFSSLEPWARFWCSWVSTTFLKSYLTTASGAAFLPKTDEDVKVLLDTFLLEKAIYELGHELSHRPDWTQIPLQGILELMDA